MTSAEAIKEVRDRFIDSVQTKNSWGKNELISLIKDIIIDVQSEIIENSEKK